MAGVQEVAALPTGLILFDVRAFKKLPPPWFTYQYKGDGPECPGCGQAKPGLQTEKASTEDVVLTRDLSLLGIPQYCAWDSWAGHIKRKVVRKPRPITPDAAGRKLRDAIRANRPHGNESIIQVQRGGLPKPPAQTVAVPTNLRDLIRSPSKSEADAIKSQIQQMRMDSEGIAVLPDGVEVAGVEPIASSFWNGMV